jgi:hypothetical protein
VLVGIGAGRRFDTNRRYRFDPPVTKPVHKSALPLPLPPKLDRPADLTRDTEKKFSDTTHAVFDDTKWSSLKKYRRARGLCDRCAEKWSPGHKCASTIQLQAMQELGALGSGFRFLI